MTFRRSRLIAGAAVVAVAGAVTGGAIARADDSARVARAVTSGAIARADASNPVARAAAGGVSLSPATVEHTTRRGDVGRITIRNTTSHTLRVTVKVRPWRQARDTGDVSANLRGDLSPYVAAGRPRFNLRPGSRRVTVRVRRTPPGGSLYAGIEVFGKPLHAKARNGIVARYRVIGRLRLNPVHRRPKLRIGKVDVKRYKRGKVLILAVRNIGNTLDRVGGSTSITGPARRRSPIAAMTPVPGQVVYLVAGGVDGLRHGRYRAHFTITQGGRRHHASRSFSL